MRVVRGQSRWTGYAKQIWSSRTIVNKWRLKMWLCSGDFAVNIFALREDAVFVGIQETMEVGIYSNMGALLRLYRVPDVDLRLSAADIEDRKRQLLAQQPAERRAEARNQLDEMDVEHVRLYGLEK